MKRNAGTALDLGWLNRARVNHAAVMRRVNTLPGRRSVKKEHQAAWELKAVTLIDLTTLEGSDTAGRVARLCAKARQPISPALLEGLGMAPEHIRVAAVCVYPNRVRDAVAALKGSGIPVAAVAPGFPSGQMPLRAQLAELEHIIEDGAQEIDMVISRDRAILGDWPALYDEVKAFRQACGEAAHLKVILETGELPTLADVYKASLTAMMAGADFIKTSTGKAGVNATPAFGLVMCRAIRDYEALTGFKIGLKPAGGIRTAKDALNWLVLIKEELGDPWLQPELFRFGASALLTDLERQLVHHLSGRYASEKYIALG